MVVDAPFLTVLKTWTSPFEHSVIIHVCVRLEFPEVSARAPCLKISELDRFVSGFAPNTCVLPRRGRECLLRTPHTPPAVARGHRLVFAATGNVQPAGTICCRSALFSAGRHSFLPKWQFWPADYCASAFADILSQLSCFGSTPYTCMEGSLSLEACLVSFTRQKGSIRESLLSWLEG